MREITDKGNWYPQPVTPQPHHRITHLVGWPIEHLLFPPVSLMDPDTACSSMASGTMDINTDPGLMRSELEGMGAVMCISYTQ